jgi:hypothetical protein
MSNGNLGWIANFIWGIADDVHQHSIRSSDVQKGDGATEVSVHSA